MPLERRRRGVVNRDSTRARRSSHASHGFPAARLCGWAFSRGDDSFCHFRILGDDVARTPAPSPRRLSFDPEVTVCAHGRSFSRLLSGRGLLPLRPTALRHRACGAGWCAPRARRRPCGAALAPVIARARADGRAPPPQPTLANGSPTTTPVPAPTVRFDPTDDARAGADTAEATHSRRPPAPRSPPRSSRRRRRGRQLLFLRQAPIAAMALSASSSVVLTASMALTRTRRPRPRPRPAMMKTTTTRRQQQEAAGAAGRHPLVGVREAEEPPPKVVVVIAEPARARAAAAASQQQSSPEESYDLTDSIDLPELYVPGAVAALV